MALFYPRKGTLILGIISFLVVSGTFYYTYSQTKIENSDIDEAKTLSANVVSANNIDSIPTAQSDAWKKDFFSASSSTSAAPSFNHDQNPNVADQPLTFTDQFGRSFLSKVMLLQQNNQINSPQATDDLVNQSVDDIMSSAPQPKVYKISDVIVGNQSDSSTEKSYGNDVAAVLLTRFIPGDAPALTSQAIEDKDPSSLDQVGKMADSYLKMIDDLLKMTVPPNLTASHLDLLNSLSNMTFVTSGLSKIQTDPLQTIVALKMYSSAQDSLKYSLANLNDYFNQSKIYFSKGEPGVLFSTIDINQ